MVMHRALSAIGIAASCVLVSTPANAATRTAMMQITVEVRPSCGASTRSDPRSSVAFDCVAQSNALPLRRGAVLESPATGTETAAQQGKAGLAQPALMVTEF